VWDPEVYLKFEAERTRPVGDLLSAVDVAEPVRVVDLGCGTGTSTRLLARRWPEADVLGVDSSPQMVQAARAEPVPPGVRPPRYAVGDVREWRAGDPVDVLFSNALLQWVPGHLDLFPGWLAELSPAGSFAFSVPGNFDEPAHALLRELAGSPRWRGLLDADARRDGDRVHPPRVYLDRLLAAGADVEAWETVYLHRLSGPDPVLAWMSGTGLRPVLAALDADPTGRQEFLDSYRAALRQAYPPDAGGRTPMPFRRLFVVARKVTPGQVPG
jgi:trans-aconitate 2-methyltransferase